jgi:hypothetical protein
MQSRLPPITLLIGTNPQIRNPEGVRLPAAGAIDKEILLSLSVRRRCDGRQDATPNPRIGLNGYLGLA